MSYIDKVNKVLADRGYDTNARLADYRNPAGNKSYVAKPAASSFLPNVGKTLGGVAGFAGDALLNTAKSFGAGAIAFGKEGMRNVNMLQAGGKMNRTAAEAKQLQDQFKAGKISAAKFQKEYDRLFAENKAASKSRESQKKSTKQVLKDLTVGNLETGANVAALVAGGGGLANAAKGSGLKGFAARTVDMGASSKTVQGAAGALIKGQMTKGSLESIPGTINKALRGDVVGAGVDTALMLSGGLKGGPLGALTNQTKKAGNIITKNLYDTQGLYDVVKLKGGKTVNQVIEEVSKTNPTLTKSFINSLKVSQDLAIQEHGGSLKYTAKAIEQNQPGGKKFADMSIDEFVKAMQGNIKTKADLQRQAAKLGLKIPEGTAPVAARLTPEMKAGIAKQLGESDDPAKVLAQLKKSKVIQGPNLPGQLDDMVSRGLRGKELSKEVNRLKAVAAGLDANGNMIKTKDGKFLGFAKGAGVVKKPGEVADIVKGEKARFGAIGKTLEKVGLSTKESSPELQRGLFKKVSDTFKKSVDDSNLTMSGDEALNKLNTIAKDKAGVTDIRQLRAGEIAGELRKSTGISKGEAKTLLKLYKKSFSSVGLSERGLGGKVTDLNMRYNPIAPGYSRIQGIARYEMNPAFMVQEGLETKIGTKMFTGRTAVPGRDYSQSVKALADNGFFKNAGFGGVGADEFAGVTAKLKPWQENDLAAGIEALGGTTPAKIKALLADPKNTEVLQNLKAVVQYPDRGFTSSNFMKALNLAVFPMRYNLKVTQLAAKALAKQPGATQVKVLSGLKQFADWQKTPEGIKWQSDNSEAIGILKWATPIGSVETIGKMLGGNFKDLGTLGGLPFGVISGVIEGQGLAKSSTPYLDPKTGEVVPDKIPVDVKARAQQALSDIVNTMFTYPGRQVGLKSKKELVGDITGILPGLQGGKFESVTRTDLTPQQKKQQAVLRAGQSTTSLKAPSVMKNRSVDLSSKKPVVIKPIYKATKAKRAKAKASAPGTWRPN